MPILVSYFFLAVAVTLLLMDATGQMRFSAGAARRLRAVGVIVAGGPGLAPVAALLAGRLEMGWPFHLIALAYLGLFLAWTAAVAGWLGGPRGGGGLRRTVYAALIFLAALPSAALLVLTPFVAIAGLGLARPHVEQDGRVGRRG